MQRLTAPMLLLSPLVGIVLALTLYADLLLPAQVGHAQTVLQERERCFAETGYCIRGALLDYWEQYGGLETFGYPISPLRLETVEGSWTGPVQWFERDRLEDHGVQGVLPGRLGAYLLVQRGFDWWANPYEGGVEPGCEVIDATRQLLCEPFLSHWRYQGGVERFGYPLTGPRTETIGDWTGTVQYFERRRMEHHYAADGSDLVVLGRLGSQIMQQSGSADQCTTPVLPALEQSYQRVGFRQTLGCPQDVYERVPATRQLFERGELFAVTIDGQRTTFAFSAMPSLFQRVATRPADRPVPAANLPEPPAGVQSPAPEFAHLWAEDGDLAATLGWATDGWQTTDMTVQRFAQGWLLWAHGSDLFYAFGPTSDAVNRFPRPVLVQDEQGNATLLAGKPAPPLGGQLVVRTQSVDFYRTTGGLTPGEIRALSTGIEEAIASGTTMMGNPLRGRISIRFEPRQYGVCAIRGLTLSSERTIRMFYEPGYDLRRIQVILAHEIIHQLQHDYYGVPDHLQSDVILLEGMAVWASGPYYRTADGEPYYRPQVRQKLRDGTMLPLTTSLSADCRTSTRVSIYDQWASFSEYLLVRYGREPFDMLYRASSGRPAGSANYQGVYGKTLAELEAEWIAWLQQEAM